MPDAAHDRDLDERAADGLARLPGALLRKLRDLLMPARAADESHP